MSDKDYKFCPKCGNKIPSSMNFCPNCGFKQPTENEINHPETFNNISEDNSPKEKNNIVTGFTDLWKNMFFISGRMNRARFWFGYLDLMILNMILMFFWGFALGFEAPMMIINIVVAIISSMSSIAFFTATIRRLHDTDRKGHYLWLTLIPAVGQIVVIVLLATKKIDKGNRFNNENNKDWFKSFVNWLILIFVFTFIFVYFNIFSTSYSNYNAENTLSNLNIEGINLSSYNYKQAEKNAVNLGYSSLKSSDNINKSMNIYKSQVLDIEKHDSYSIFYIDNLESSKIAEIIYPYKNNLSNSETINIRGIINSSTGYGSEDDDSYKEIPSIIATKITKE